MMRRPENLMLQLYIYYKRMEKHIYYLQPANFILICEKQHARQDIQTTRKQEPRKVQKR